MDTRADSHVGDLFRQNPDAFRPALANTLNNLGIRYSDLEQFESSLQAHQEAVDYCRELSERNPTAFLADLANALSNLATIQIELDLSEEALANAQQSVALLRQLAAEDPGSFEPDLATSLVLLRLAVDLRHCGGQSPPAHRRVRLTTAGDLL